MLAPLRPSLVLCLVATALTAAPPPAEGTRALRRGALERALQEVERELLTSVDPHVDHSSWEDPWVVESAAYEVRTTRSWFVADKIARDQEAMLEEFRVLLGREGWVPSQRLPIWIFPTIQGYNALGQNADEHSSFYGSFHATNDPAAPVATFLDPNLTRLGMFVTHAAFHQFEGRAMSVQVPLWVSEGLASYFSLYWDWGWGARRFREIASGSRWVSLSGLLNAGLPDYVPNAEDRFVQLGMLMRYLLHHREDTRIPEEGAEEPAASFREFLRVLYAGGDAEDTGFARAYGRLTTELEQEFRNFDFGT